MPPALFALLVFQIFLAQTGLFLNPLTYVSGVDEKKKKKTFKRQHILS
jgi:hypothetical protein